MTLFKAGSVLARSSSYFVVAALVASSLVLAGCGTLPANTGKADSVSLPLNPESPLVKIAKASSPGEDQTGVRLLPLGAFSLDTRLQLAQRATTSLDVQYYQFENDPTGRLLLTALRDASIRGVRVRLLVDDLYTTHTDPLLRGLAAFPNVEVHLFNPFCCARGGGVGRRYTASLFDFGRLNHRMHNKLFVADGVMAVIGGRNIADEYFLRSETANFVDMDAFVMGAAVKELSAIFDRYWNSEVVFPIELIGEPLGDLEARRRSLDEVLENQPAAAADRPADDRRARLRAAERGLRPRPGRPAMGHRPGLLRPAGEAALQDAAGRLRDQRHQRRDDAGVAGQERAGHHLALHDPGPRGRDLVREPAEEQGQGRGGDQLAGRDRRAAGAQRLFQVPRGHAEGRGRPLRAEPDPDAEHEAARHVRQVARPPPCQDRGDRQAPGVRRLDEPRSALGQRQHRARHVHRQPGARQGAAARRQHQPARGRLPGAARSEDPAAAMADDGRRQRGRARWSSRSRASGCGCTTCSWAGSCPSSSSDERSPQGRRGTIRACPATPSRSPSRSRPLASCPWRWRSRCASSTASMSTRATAAPPKARPA